MKQICSIIADYLIVCQHQRNLSPKTINAYNTDIVQYKRFSEQLIVENAFIQQDSLEHYIQNLHIKYQPKTVKRKIASLKALFKYMYLKNIIQADPWQKIQYHFKEALVLPKTIPLHIMQELFSILYTSKRNGAPTSRNMRATRDIAICEMLFSTGIRISELCSIDISDIDFISQDLLIHGKGSKERIVHIGCSESFAAILEYYKLFHPTTTKTGPFFITESGAPVSDQSVRRMLKKYSKLLSSDIIITPHMIRHTFATALLEADVDIRYIQKMLGHSSIHTTEIYTHVSINKVREILETKHPRKDFRIKSDG